MKSGEPSEKPKKAKKKAAVDRKPMTVSLTSYPQTNDYEHVGTVGQQKNAPQTSHEQDRVVVVAAPKPLAILHLKNKASSDFVRVTIKAEQQPITTPASLDTQVYTGPLDSLKAVEQMPEQPLGSLVHVYRRQDFTSSEIQKERRKPFATLHLKQPQPSTSAPPVPPVVIVIEDVDGDQGKENVVPTTPLLVQKKSMWRISRFYTKETSVPRELLDEKVINEKPKAIIYLKKQQQQVVASATPEETYSAALYSTNKHRDLGDQEVPIQSLVETYHSDQSVATKPFVLEELVEGGTSTVSSTQLKQTVETTELKESDPKATLHLKTTAAYKEENTGLRADNKKPLAILHLKRPQVAIQKLEKSSSTEIGTVPSKPVVRVWQDKSVAVIHLKQPATLIEKDNVVSSGIDQQESQKKKPKKWEVPQLLHLSKPSKSKQVEHEEAQKISQKKVAVLHLKQSAPPPVTESISRRKTRWVKPRALLRPLHFTHYQNLELVDMPLQEWVEVYHVGLYTALPKASQLKELDDPKTSKYQLNTQPYTGPLQNLHYQDLQLENIALNQLVEVYHSGYYTTLPKPTKQGGIDGYNLSKEAYTGPLEELQYQGQQLENMPLQEWVQTYHSGYYTTIPKHTGRKEDLESCKYEFSTQPFSGPWNLCNQLAGR
uniref:Uncharacterized protein n=1 Tax=Ditylenchus dipsaci TaxID=166011 RepID=A0A915EIU1_9BILA